MEDGRKRAVIENLSPEVDCGRFPIKRVIGERVIVQADVFADSHDVLAAAVKYRYAHEEEWSEIRMEPTVNDRWEAAFLVSRLGTYLYTVEGWIDGFRTWCKSLEKKLKAGLDVKIELLAGLEFLQSAMLEAKGPDAEDLKVAHKALSGESQLPSSAKAALALSPRIGELIDRWHPRQNVVQYHRQLQVTVDPILARFGAWYELFPRSTAPSAGRHGTFKDCEAQLPRLAEMGFDVLYLPPIHPIGQSFRKGRNNSLASTPIDPGSPWAIGSEMGGHKSVHPQLGTLEDFRSLVRKARESGIEVALDIALQCSPDHPYVREHPEWFRRRPDGSIQYAENPPKKYQDIYPFNFETDQWQALWEELKSIFDFWFEQGVSIFRVDNPHTKPFRFWEWCLGELKRAHPELIFLSEAFTRPKVMYYLAKVGFSQSYNYFPWRNSKYELVKYLTELTQSEVREFFRPSFWPNTPDILTQYLRYGGRPAFMIRLVLAATLAATYGIYGPAFELCEAQPREPETEEYLNSEKYEIRYWNLDATGNLQDLIKTLNQIRRDNPALQRNEYLRFQEVDNEQILAYSKSSPDDDDILIVAVNLDPHHVQRGWLTLPLAEWGLQPQDNYQVHELITNARYLWTGSRNYLELDPQFLPAHILRLRRYVRTEQDFDYFM
jgi:starch synthase (maltosyl-transferring)